MKTTTRAYDSDGTTLRYEEAGDGPVVVLVHGHPFDRTMWTPQLALADRVRVVLPDLRGYGESDHDGATVTPLGRFARDLEALLDHLEVETATVCGLSMAGQIVMQLLSQAPGRIEALGLFATTARAESDHGREVRAEQAARLEAEGMEPYAREVLETMVAVDNIAADPALGEHVMQMMTRTDPRAAAAALRGRAERPDYLSVLATCEVPALVVVGEQDDFTPVSAAREMASALAHGSLEVVQHCAHMPNLERPAEFNAHLSSFLTTVGALR